MRGSQVPHGTNWEKLRLMENGGDRREAPNPSLSWFAVRCCSVLGRTFPSVEFTCSVYLCFPLCSVYHFKNIPTLCFPCGESAWLKMLCFLWLGPGKMVGVVFSIHVYVYVLEKLDHCHWIFCKQSCSHILNIYFWGGECKFCCIQTSRKMKNTGLIASLPVWYFTILKLRNIDRLKCFKWHLNAQGLLFWEKRKSSGWQLCYCSLSSL